MDNINNENQPLQNLIKSIEDRSSRKLQYSAYKIAFGFVMVILTNLWIFPYYVGVVGMGSTIDGLISLYKSNRFDQDIIFIQKSQQERSLDIKKASWKRKRRLIALDKEVTLIIENEKLKNENKSLKQQVVCLESNQKSIDNNKTYTHKIDKEEYRTKHTFYDRIKYYKNWFEKHASHYDESRNSIMPLLEALDKINLFALQTVVNEQPGNEFIENFKEGIKVVLQRHNVVKNNNLSN